MEMESHVILRVWLVHLPLPLPLIRHYGTRYSSLQKLNINYHWLQCLLFLLLTVKTYNIILDCGPDEKSLTTINIYQAVIMQASLWLYLHRTLKKHPGITLLLPTLCVRTCVCSLGAHMYGHVCYMHVHCMHVHVESLQFNSQSKEVFFVCTQHWEQGIMSTGMCNHYHSCEPSCSTATDSEATWCYKQRSYKTSWLSHS